MKNFSFIKKGVAGIFLILSSIAYAQYPSSNPACDPDVTYYSHDFTGNSAGIWSTPNDSRNAHCCGVSGPDKCIALDILLDVNAAGIEIDMIGADPAGSLFYQINCTGSYPGGTVKCITGGGLQHITFCKPGSNKNIYKITSVSKPLFPFDDTVRVGCSTQLTTLGVVSNQTHWTSLPINGKPQGYYDSLLSCTNCASPIYTPRSWTPSFVKYQVCGYPQASMCGFNVIVCDTVTIFNLPKLLTSISPAIPTFCDLGSGSGITLTAIGSGGLPPYTYTWRDGANVIVGTGTTFFATQSANYSVEIKDGLYNTSSCPSYLKTITVVKGNPPSIVNAGTDQKVCATSPTILLNGIVKKADNSTGAGVWIGGNGIFNPNRNDLKPHYTPTSSEILSGSVSLFLSSSGFCSEKVDTVKISFSDSIKIALSAPELNCYGNTTLISSIVSGGTNPLNYFWNTSATTSSITEGQGNYTLTITDSIGCTGIKTKNIVSPNLLTINFSSLDVTLNGGNDGSATVISGGGTPPYNYLWSTGATTATINSLVYGSYSVTITDSKGCTINGSVVINEPGCLGFNVTASSTNVNCYGANNGEGIALPTGGTAPYTYLWNDSASQANDTAFNLAPGSYTITVNDVFNCIQTANISITQPANLINTMNHVDVTIVGSNNGSATANPFGGTPPYTYLWSNGGTTQSITNLFVGGYKLTITDAHGCNFFDSTYVSEPACTNLTLNVVTTNVACFGGYTGSATANVSNAIAPYTITWSNSQTGFVASGLSAGNYTVSITDAVNCAQFNSFTITEPPLLSVSASYNAITCNGSNNGTIDIALTGGTFPYTFNWSNGSTNEDLINLGPDTYSVTVTDNKGCHVNTSTQIIEPVLMTISSIITNPTCIYGSDGAIDLTVNGGTAPYFYTWSNSATTQDINGIEAGGYQVIVRDANSCNLKISPALFSVNQPDSLIITSYTVACPIAGASTSLATVTPSGGNVGTYQVSFDNGLSFLPAGDYDTYLANGSNYYVVLKDNKACTSILSDTITIKPATVITNVIFNKCFAVGTTTTLVTVSASGGDNGPNSVSYDNGLNFQSAGTMNFLLPVGISYNIIVQDGRGCKSTATTISIPAILTANASSATVFGSYNISCNGATNGSINLTITGGLAPFSFAWTGPNSFTSTSKNLTGLAAGTYDVIVTDANNCTFPTSITLTQPAILIANASSPIVADGYNITCNGASNGSINLAISGGTFPYLYAWTGPGTFYSILQNPIGLAAGTYNVTVTDANGCTATTSITLSQPSILSATTTSPTVFGGYNISCNGAMNGAISLNVTGGSINYSYSWTASNGFSSILQNLSGLDSGAYHVVITDANGCNAIANIILTEPPVLTSVAISPTVIGGYNINCNNAINGSINLNVLGGTSLYTYNWTGSNGFSSTSQNLTGLDVGTYAVIVTDANGCTANSNATLTQPDLLTAIATSPTVTGGYNITCNGTLNGSINLTASGGTTPYSYAWTGPGTFYSILQNPIGLGAGTYSVTVTDINGCTATTSITLTQASTLATNAISTTVFGGYNISCNGALNGIANLSVTGGASPFSYLWTGPGTFTSTSQNLSGIGAGTYSVIVTDANNCTAISGVLLTEPAILTVGATSPTIAGGYNITCNGATNGTINLTVAGGTASYVYSWTGPSGFSSSSQNLSGLAAGTYSITVTDVNGCTATTNITLAQPPVLNAIATVTSNYNGQQISCFNTNDGLAFATPNGGTSPYSYSWSTTPVQTTATANNLGASTYTVTITDANLCATSATTLLTQPVQLSINASIISNYNGQNISCNTANDGIASALANGGTLPYTYTWSTVPAQTTSNAINLGANTYTVSVNDKNNCTLSTTVALNQPEILKASITSPTVVGGYNISCYGASNGAINLSVLGGTTAYSFVWIGPSNFTSTTQNPSGLIAGTYTVTITDANGCSIIKNITLTQPTILSANAISPTVAGGYNITCNGSSTGGINLTATGGTMAYSFAWNGPGGFTSNSKNISGLGAGTYNVTLSDANECIAATSITLTQPNVLVANAVVSSNYNGQQISCLNANNGSAHVTTTGGTAPYSFNWSTTPIQTTSTANNLGANPYTVIITDANGCNTSSTVTLTQPIQLNVTASVISNYNGENIKCNGENNGLASATGLGGTSPYSYTWSTVPTQLNDTAFSLGASTYTVNVIDVNNCTSSATVSLTQPTIINANITSPTVVGGYNITCDGASTGSIDLIINGGVTPYSYAWNNGATTEDVSNLVAGNYKVIYSDANGCIDSASIVLTQASSLTSDILTQAIRCYGDSNGIVEVNVQGGEKPYIYSWSNGATTSIIENVLPGTYYATITDVNGCIRKDTAEVQQPDSLIVSLSSSEYPNGHNISTFMGNDGSINLYANGGVETYSYLWSNNETLQNISELHAGEYTVLVTDNNGCTASAYIKLNQPMSLEMPTGFTPNNDGYNDNFVVRGIEAFNENAITIYNRWGNIVYKKEQYNNEWNGGNTNGERLPDGIYFVVLEINNGEINLHGYVEMKR